MDTTTSNPTSPASGLPTLTPAERRIALAWIDRGESTLRDVAAQLDLAADELLDILTQPHVAAYIAAADTVIQLRKNILARYDDIEARQSLVAIAKNPEADHATRLRAAITILQGPPPRRAPASPAVPASPQSPTTPGRPQPDRPTSVRPTPAPTSAHPPSAQPAPVRADNCRAEKPLLPQPSIHTAARLNRTAGAPIARHDRIAAEATTHTPRSASPAASGRPP